MVIANLRLKPTAKRNRIIIIFAGLLFCVLTSGCVNLYDPESSQDNHNEVIAVLRDDQEFEQRFSSKHSGISGLDIWVKTDPNSQDFDGSLQVELFHGSPKQPPFYSASFSIKNLTTDAPLHMIFPSRSGLPPQNYTIKIKSHSASVQLYGRNADIYSLGEASLDGNLLEADLGFYLYDAYGIKAFIDDLKLVAVNWWVVLASILLLFIPGWLILDISGISTQYDIGEQIGLSTAISVSLVATSTAWTTLVGIHWSKSMVLTTAALLSLLTLWRIYKNKTKKRDRNYSLRSKWIQLGLGGVFAITLITRLVMVRNLVAPPWVDSIHHGMITQMILKTGEYPRSYEPYLNVSGYHPGFHSLVATYDWLTGLNIPLAMLILGQILNALIVFAVYLFSNIFIKSKIAGLFAALAAGLLSPMPAYYTSWGRYPQLVGLLILPAGLSLILKLCENRPQTPGYKMNQPALRNTLLAGLLFSGLLITHYRVAGFFISLILLVFFVRNLTILRTEFNKSAWISELKRLFLVITITAVFGLPWLPQVMFGLILPKFKVGKPAALFSGFQASYLTSAYGLQLLILAGAGLLIALIRKKSWAVTLILWVGSLFFLANLSYFHLPGGAFINNNSVGITLFLPLAVFFGYFIAETTSFARNLLPANFKIAIYPTLVIITLIVGISAAGKIIPILNPITFLARQPDFQAIEWIDLHIPPGSKIMINPFLWGYGLYAGSDGGYWISALTGCLTIPPPVLYGMDNDQSRIKHTNEFIAASIESANDIDKLADLLRRENIRYIYLGARGGIFSPSKLVANQNFAPLYQKDGVWILQVR